jgi:hypothetical protein
MAIDLTGKTFGRLDVIGRVDPSPYKSREHAWQVRCKCGESFVTRGYSLRVGDTTSCGCARKERIGNLNKSHGRAKTTEYRIWAMMRVRCLNKANKAYQWYGGRGITICDRWLSSFENFFSDMGKRPSPKHSIDRINHNGNYTPENCRWADTKTQGRNRRGVKLSPAACLEIVELRRSGMIYSEIAKLYGVDTANIYQIMKGNSWGDITGISK